jgi:cytochrome c556
LVAVADKKDVPAVTTLGGTLDEVCESCHKVFWYPDPLPIITTKQ